MATGMDRPTVMTSITSTALRLYTAAGDRTTTWDRRDTGMDAPRAGTAPQEFVRVAAAVPLFARRRQHDRCHPFRPARAAAACEAEDGVEGAYRCPSNQKLLKRH